MSSDEEEGDHLNQNLRSNENQSWHEYETCEIQAIP